MTPSFLTTYNLPDLTYVRIYDNSVFDITTPQSSINATRLMFATVNSVNQINTNVKDLIAFKEYIVTAGSAIINGVTYGVGDLIYLALNTTIGDEATVSETGYYGIRSTYLPNGSYVQYSPSQMIYGVTSLTFPDNVITLRYELYQDEFAAGSVTVSAETQFIVKGTQNDFITIGSETYYVGEVFTRNSNFTFANGQGTNFVVAFTASTTSAFRTWYQNWKLWEEYVNKIATSYQLSQSFLADFNAITARIQQEGMFENQSFSVSLQGVQDLMEEVLQNYQLK